MGWFFDNDSDERISVLEKECRELRTEIKNLRNTAGVKMEGFGCDETEEVGRRLAASPSISQVVALDVWATYLHEHGGIEEKAGLIAHDLRRPGKTFVRRIVDALDYRERAAS